MPSNIEPNSPVDGIIIEPGSLAHTSEPSLWSEPLSVSWFQLPSPSCLLLHTLIASCVPTSTIDIRYHKTLG